MSELIKFEKQEFIERFNPTNMLKEFRNVTSLPAAIEANARSMAHYKREIGEDPILALIELHLISLNESINVSNPLKTTQIIEISIEIMTSYYYMSMVEIGYIFRKAKRGEFGKFYNSISMPEVLSWFDKYAEERSSHFVNKQLDKHSYFRDDSLRSEDRKAWERHEKLINKNAEK